VRRLARGARGVGARRGGGGAGRRRRRDPDHARGPAAGERGGDRAGSSKAVRASYAGVPGHPALLEDSLFDTLLGLRGDAGARGAFDPATTHLVPCEDVAAATDVDLAGDLAALSEQAPGG